MGGSIFVTKAMMHAADDKKLVIQHKARLMLCEADENQTGWLSWESFVAQTQSPKMQQMMKEICLDDETAHYIFGRVGANGECEVDELVEAFCWSDGATLWRQ